jgi:hypothetical protein
MSGVVVEVMVFLVVVENVGFLGVMGLYNTRGWDVFLFLAW